MLFRSALIVIATATSTLAQGVGQGTWFTPGLGACGFTNSPSDFIIAVSVPVFNNFPGAGPNPNADPICGRSITINYNGKNVQASIVDKCYLCGQNDIDMSPALFEQFADTSVGRLYGVSWWYN